MQVMFGDTNESSVELLNRDGWDVITPRGQGCCGALYAHSGQLAKARDCARRNIAAFENEPLDAIIINAAGCGSTLVEYGELLKDDPGLGQAGRGVQREGKRLGNLAGQFAVRAFRFGRESHLPRCLPLGPRAGNHGRATRVGESQVGGRTR